MARFTALIGRDDRLRASLAAATRYERARRRRLAARQPGPPRDAGASLATGIAGVRRPEALKCLHPHAAHALARPGYLLGERILAAAAPVFGERACCTPSCGASPGHADAPPAGA